MKDCAKCGEAKPPGDFPKVGRVCRKCISKRSREWQLANPERANAAKQRWAERNPEYQKKYYDENREQRREKNRRRRQNPEFREDQRQYLKRYWQENRDVQRVKNRARYVQNREARIAAAAKWNRENPDKRRTAVFADSQRRRGASMDVDAKAYADVLYRDPCGYCGADGGHIDHIVPLTTKLDSAWQNLTSACRSCNSSKNAKPLLVFLAERFAA